MKKLQPDKLEPKSEKCVFIGYPKETVGYTFYHRSEGNTFIAKNGSFLEKEFLSKEVSGRKVELDEVTVPAPLLESSSSQKSVLVTNTPISEEANDIDHKTSDQVTTEPRRSSRVRSAPEWYGNPVLKVMLLDHDKCKYHPSGHIYFSLKDESGTIACVMFAGSRAGLSFTLARFGEIPPCPRPEWPLRTPQADPAPPAAG